MAITGDTYGVYFDLSSPYTTSGLLGGNPDYANFLTTRVAPVFEARSPEIVIFNTPGIRPYQFRYNLSAIAPDAYDFNPFALEILPTGGLLHYSSVWFILGPIFTTEMIEFYQAAPMGWRNLLTETFASFERMGAAGIIIPDLLPQPVLTDPNQYHQTTTALETIAEAAGIGVASMTFTEIDPSVAQPSYLLETRYQTTANPPGGTGGSLHLLNGSEDPLADATALPEGTIPLFLEGQWATVAPSLPAYVPVVSLANTVSVVIGSTVETYPALCTRDDIEDLWGEEGVDARLDDHLVNSGTTDTDILNAYILAESQKVYSYLIGMFTPDSIASSQFITQQTAYRVAHALSTRRGNSGNSSFYTHVVTFNDMLEAILAGKNLSIPGLVRREQDVPAVTNYRVVDSMRTNDPIREPTNLTNSPNEFNKGLWQRPRRGL